MKSLHFIASQTISILFLNFIIILLYVSKKKDIIAIMYARLSYGHSKQCSKFQV